MINGWDISQRCDLSPETWRFLRQNGFFGLIIPKRYGGKEFSAIGHSAVVTKIASRSTVAAVTVMVLNSLSSSELLLHYGTEAQQRQYLPRLAAGEILPCFGLTGPEASSDASATQSTGHVVIAKYRNEEVLGIRLNWTKRCITLAPVADLIGLAFRLHDPDGLLGGACRSRNYLRTSASRARRN